MNRGFLLSMLIALVLPLPVSAQVGTTGICTMPNPPPLAITPSPASTGQPVMITVAKGSFAPKSVRAEIAGKAINVTMTGFAFGFSPPAACGRVTVGPLGEGSYTVNYFLVMNDGAPSLESSAVLLVVGEAIPTVSPLGTATLSVLVGLSTLMAFRLKRRRAPG